MKSMAAAEYIGLITLGLALFVLAAIVTWGPITGMRGPRQRGLLNRLFLGNPLTGLSELRRRDGLSGFFFGEHRH